MKRKSTIICLVVCILCLLLVLTPVLYHNVGWFRGDTLEYIKEHYAPGGKTIVDGEFLLTGEDEQGGFILYQVAAEDGTSHLIRVHIVFHRSLRMIGPEFKIKGISEIDHYDDIAQR